MPYFLGYLKRGPGAQKTMVAPEAGSLARNVARPSWGAPPLGPQLGRGSIFPGEGISHQNIHVSSASYGAYGTLREFSTWTKQNHDKPAQNLGERAVAVSIPSKFT